jgi:butyrate kinase
MPLGALKMEREALSLAGGVKHQNSSFDAVKNRVDWREPLGALRMEWETLSLAGGV